jgi:hypothetical protein
MPRPYLYLILSLHRHICHNFGPDALARKQCRARVLAALGRALGVGPHGPVPPCPSDHAKSVRAKQVRPCTGGCWGATAPALEAWRQYEQVRWNRLQTNLSIPPLVAILAQKPPMLCPNGHQPFGTHAQHATLPMHSKCCNFRPTGPFGPTLRAGCVIYGVGRFVKNL